jgi:shikimate kinase
MDAGGSIFLVGPGSVGKTTVGPLVAAALGLRFVDLDGEFCASIALIPRYIADCGYPAYCEANASLAERIITSLGDIVLATSSGFLAHNDCDDVVTRNRALIRRTGRSFLLMPSARRDEAARTVARRQVERWPEREYSVEYDVAERRLQGYVACADEVVLAHAAPELVARRIAEVWEVRRLRSTDVSET